MDATPKGEDLPRRKTIVCEIAVLDDGDDLLEYFHLIGCCRHNGMALEPFSFVELECWQEGQGLILTPWEKQTLFNMSTAYARMASLAVNPDCAPPSSIEDSNARRQIITNKIFG